MTNFIIIAIASIAIVYLQFFSKKEHNAKRTSTQDLFDFKEVYSDGVIELPGQRFRKVIQVQPINLATRSQREQVSVWLLFRTMINSLVFPVTFLVQSARLDTTDYAQKVESVVENSENEYVKKYSADYIRHIQELSENRSVQEKKYFFVVKVDIASDTVDSGVEVEDNTVAMAINAALRIANKQKRLTDEEARRLARSEIDNMIEVMQSYLTQMGIHSQTLDKKGVVDMGYTTYNRDLAHVVRTKDVDAMEMFSLFTRSLTPSVAIETVERNEKSEAV